MNKTFGRSTALSAASHAMPPNTVVAEIANEFIIRLLFSKEKSNPKKSFFEFFFRFFPILPILVPTFIIFRTPFVLKAFN
jgi:hypothetical protein